MCMSLSWGMGLFIFTSMITRGESFLRLPSQDDSESEEKVDVHVHAGGRGKRSINNKIFPSVLDLDFAVNGRPMHMHLQENTKVQTNVELFVLNEGSIIRKDIKDDDESAFYQDTERGSVFVVQRNKKGEASMLGIFHIGSSDYVLQSDNDFKFGETISKFQLRKKPFKEMNFSDVKKSVKEKTEPVLGRRRKRATGDFHVELLMVVDYSVYKFWYDLSTATTNQEKEKQALEKVRQFYAFVINGVDAMYKNLPSATFTISVVFAGIVISETTVDASWTETIKDTSKNPIQVDASVSLDKFRTWVQGQSNNLPGHDHAMLFTRYDLQRGGSTSVLGLATFGAVCKAQGQSIVEENFDFKVLGVAAHELGHSLNAEHDGVRNTCIASNAYIMAPSISPQDGLTASNPWRFSTCSTKYFNDYIDGLTASSTNCLTTFDSSYNATALSQYLSQLPGQVYDANQQCKLIWGTSSYLCTHPYNGDFTSICNVLWCYNPTRDNCRGSFAADGTVCGDKKWCKAGVCTADPKAPPGDESCLYGDRQGKFINGNLNCAEALVQFPNLCNGPSKTDCCALCAPPKTTASTTTSKSSTPKTTPTTSKSSTPKTTPTTKTTQTTKTTPTTKTTQTTKTQSTPPTTPTTKTTTTIPTTTRRFDPYYRYRRLHRFRYRLFRHHQRITQRRFFGDRTRLPQQRFFRHRYRLLQHRRRLRFRRRLHRFGRHFRLLRFNQSRYRRRRF